MRSAARLLQFYITDGHTKAAGAEEPVSSGEQAWRRFAALVCAAAFNGPSPLIPAISVLVTHGCRSSLRDSTYLSSALNMEKLSRAHEKLEAVILMLCGQPLVSEHAHEALPVSAPEALLDIDAMEDYRYLQEHLSG